MLKINVFKPPMSLLLACLDRDFQRLPERLSTHFRDEYSRDESFRAQLGDPLYKNQAETIRQLLRYGIEFTRKEVEGELKDVLTYKPGKPPLALRIERLHRKAKEVNQGAHRTFTTGRLSRIRESASFGLARAIGEEIRVHELHERDGRHSRSEAYYQVESLGVAPSFRQYLYWLVETILTNGEISKLRVCPECNDKIFERIKRQKFCSAKCKNAFNNRRHRVEAAERYRHARPEKLDRAKKRLKKGIQDRIKTTAKTPEAINEMVDELVKKNLNGKDSPIGTKKLFKKYAEELKEREIAKLP